MACEEGSDILGLLAGGPERGGPSLSDARLL